jgi:two-component system, chemotaxis family, chemotaxis protein CheY
MRILIVDDNGEIVDLLVAMLPEAEVKDTARDGMEAVALVKNSLAQGKMYDLICLDIMMPNMDGHHALKEIRALEKAAGVDLGDGAKVVMITALGDCENVFDAFHREGCDGYIIKPFERGNVQATLEKIGLV